MTAASVGGLRQYKRLPVYIEEDHNEVVPYIHRAIGSHHLPMSGIPMVHFDSHPDLLLPLHLQADHVYDKELLYSELSIENWILPLVFAGHISEIYWLKAPWADQMGDVSGQCFTVGKHKETGEIRITLDDPYFLTEALYAPESQLTDTKQATLHVITITPSGWRSGTSCSRNHPDRNYVDKSVSQCTGDICQKEDVTEQSETDSNSHTLGSSEVQKRKSVSPENSEHCETQSEVKIREKHLIAHRSLSPPRAKRNKTDDSEGTVCSQMNRTNCSVDASSTQTTKAVSDGNHLLDKSWLQELRQKLEGQPYILDIDLDFFSTKDPFQNDCSAEQASLLQQLFEFKLPTEKSEKTALEFNDARQTQLDELYEVFQQLHQQPDCVPKVEDPHRQMVLDKFIQLLPKTTNSDQPAVDFELLYRAGCTFDGSALPHHVSSPQQIQQLMDCTTQLLRSLPSPTIITVARSSVDDYCPQDQVDMIQENLLEVLNDIYKDVDVQKQYEQQQ